MARLALLAAAAAALAGCGRVWLPESVERRVGEMTSEEMRRAMPAVMNNPWNAFVQDAGRKLAAVSERPGVDYRFIIVSSPDINAFSSPDGEIFITDSLLKAAGRDELAVAAVLGHEIGHIARRHSAEVLQEELGLGSVGVLLFGFDHSLARMAGSLASRLVELGYGRDRELEADLCAVRYLTRLGYPPRTGVRFLKLLAAHENDRLPMFVRYFLTHPPVEERIRYAERYEDSLKR
jgi:predicted Zn-dependent protease